MKAFMRSFICTFIVLYLIKILTLVAKYGIQKKKVIALFLFLAKLLLLIGLYITS